MVHPVGDWPDLPEVGDQGIVLPRQGRAAVDAKATIIDLDKHGLKLVFESGNRDGASQQRLLEQGTRGRRGVIAVADT